MATQRAVVLRPQIRQPDYPVAHPPPTLAMPVEFTEVLRSGVPVSITHRRVVEDHWIVNQPKQPKKRRKRRPSLVSRMLYAYGMFAGVLAIIGMTAFLMGAVHGSAVTMLGGAALAIAAGLALREAFVDACREEGRR